MHIKATGQITLSAAFFQWLTTAANKKVKNRNAKACWLEISLTSYSRVVGLQCSYLSLLYSYTNSTNLGAVVSLPSWNYMTNLFRPSDYLSVTNSKTAPKKTARNAILNTWLAPGGQGRAKL